MASCTTQTSHSQVAQVRLEFLFACILVLTVGQLYWTRWEGLALWSNAPAQCDVMKGLASYGTADSSAMFDRYVIEHWIKSFLFVSLCKALGLPYNIVLRGVYTVGLSFEFWEKFSTRAHRGDSYLGDSVVNVFGDMVTNQMAGEFAWNMPAVWLPFASAVGVIVWGQAGTTDFQSLHKSLRFIDEWNCGIFHDSIGSHFWEFLLVVTVATGIFISGSQEIINITAAKHSSLAVPELPVAGRKGKRSASCPHSKAGPVVKEGQRARSWSKTASRPSWVQSGR